MIRYRLRFQVQELDLRLGETLLGRGDDCHVTIDDPLVSRHHARIFFEDERIVLHDLGSRNGVRVNNVLIKDPVTLQDGDRVRIGTQEVVVCRSEDGTVTATRRRQTGSILICPNCDTSRSREAGVCPKCGAAEASNESTLSGDFGAGPHAGNVPVYVELLECALRLSRLDEAARILERATRQLDDRITAGVPIDAVQLSRLAVVVGKIALARGQSKWAVWSADVHRRASVVPSADAYVMLASLAERFPKEMEEPLRLIERARGPAP